MRIVALVFATLFLLGTTALGAIATRRGLKDAKDISEVYGAAKDTIAAAAAADPKAAELKHLAERTGSLKAGAVVFGAVALLALGLLVMSFAGKPAVSILAIGVVATALIATFLSPQYDLGPFAPASARSLGYVITALAVAGAGAAYGAMSLKRRRQATV